MIKKHIPNAITCLNLLCGTIALTFAFKGQAETAFWFMVGAAVCDFLDGFAARLLKAYSPVGKELDSLADLVSFGVVPATLLYVLYVPYAPCPICSYFPYLVVICSALRLAKFNLDERQTENFIGLATPANAFIIASMVVLAHHAASWAQMMQNAWFIPCLALVLSLLLVSELPMFSLKIKHLTYKDNKPRVYFLLVAAGIVIAALLFHWHWSLALLLVMCAYLLISAFTSFSRASA